MAKTVVGLFDSTNDAQDVARELRDYGLNNSDINIVSQGVFGGSENDMLGMVTDAGIPSSDARLYVEGVRRGGSLVIAHADDNQVNDVVNIMNRHNIVDIDSRRSMYGGTDTALSADADVTRTTLGTTDVDTTYTDTARTADVDTTYTGTTRTADYDTTRTTNVDTGDQVAVPIVEEELRVGKREVEKGSVRVETRVEEVPVEEQVTVRDEEVRIERRPVDQPVSAADLNAFQEGVIEVRETDEEVVADKQARVVEEVVIRKDVEERTETVRDTVRRTDVDVEEVPGQTRTSGYTTTGTTDTTLGTTGTTGTGYTTTDTTLGSTGTTGTTGTGTTTDRSLTDRIEGVTGLDIDRDGDVDDRSRRV